MSAIAVGDIVRFRGGCVRFVVVKEQGGAVSCKLFPFRPDDKGIVVSKDMLEKTGDRVALD